MYINLIFFPKKNIFCCCNFLKILMVSDKTIHKAFRIHETISTKPVREFSLYLPKVKLYIGFNPLPLLYLVQSSGHVNNMEPSSHREKKTHHRRWVESYH